MILALLVGCASTGNGPALRVARAFADLCAPLETNGIAARAAEYAFIHIEPKPRANTTATAHRREGMHSWTRTDGVVRATLSWNEPARSCELALVGLDAGEAEPAFENLVASFVRNGREATPLPIPRSRAKSLALRRSVVIGPPSLAPGAIRVLSLRTDERPSRAVQAVFGMRIAGIDRADGDDATPIGSAFAD